MAISRNGRRAVLLGIACILGVCTHLLYEGTWSSLENTRTSIRHALITVGISPVPNATTSSGEQLFCTAAEYTTGQWIRRANPPATIEDIRHLYSVTVSFHVCKARMTLKIDSRYSRTKVA
jgi:hypothetical protein